MGAAGNVSLTAPAPDAPVPDGWLDWFSAPVPDGWPDWFSAPVPDGLTDSKSAEKC